VNFGQSLMIDRSFFALRCFAQISNVLREAEKQPIQFQKNTIGKSSKNSRTINESFVI
jgi:hypothetical protein